MHEVLFGSDNQAGVSERVMEAIIRSNDGTAVAYGDDAYTAEVDKVFSDVFEHQAFVFAAPTGTAANALGLAAVTPPYGETICHEAAHILTTEAGAPEFYAGGSRLHGMPGPDGKIRAEDLERLLVEKTRPSRHHLLCASLSLTQASELGTLYSQDELETLCVVARAHGLRVHLDGARFSNAVAALGAAPADLTWRAGVDVLSLGSTKNGTMNAEAVIVFDPALARDIGYRQKRAGLLTSKMRYVSAQLLAFLADDHWLDNARRANATASALARLLSRVPGVELLHPVQSNLVFAAIAPEVMAGLERCGLSFRRWDPAHPTHCRMVTSFQDDASKLARLEAAISCLMGIPLSIDEGLLGTIAN